MPFKCYKCGSEVRKYITRSIFKEYIIKKMRKKENVLGNQVV